MMNLRAFIGVLALSCMLTTAFAQPIKFATQEVTLKKNVCGLRCCPKRILEELGTPIDGRYYLVVQFKNLPTAENHEKLKEYSIKLLGYIGSNAYFASVPVEHIGKALRKSGVIAVAEPQWEWKSAEAIVNDRVPEWAQRGSRIAITLSWYEGLSPEWIRARFAELGYPIQPNQASSILRMAELVVSRAEAIKLAKEPWVQRVGIQGPPMSIDPILPGDPRLNRSEQNQILE